MQLTRHQIIGTLKAFRFDSTPRFVGNPYQKAVLNLKTMIEWFEANADSGQPIFIQKNSYQLNRKNPSDASQIIFDGALGDLDTGVGTERLWSDVQGICKLLDEKGVPHGNIFSGSGVQMRVLFEREVRPFDYLRKWERALWLGMKQELKYDSIDLGPSSDPRRIVRFPFSRYSTHKDGLKDAEGRPIYVPKDNFAFAIPHDWIQKKTYEDIYKTSFDPPYVNGDAIFKGFDIKLESFVREMGWEKLQQDFGPIKSDGGKVAGPAGDLLDLYVPDKLCIRNVYQSKLRHHHLIALIAELQSAGLDQSEIVKMLDELYETCQWSAPSPYEYRRQVKGVASWASGAFDCRWLQQNGLCVGEKCSLYALSPMSKTNKAGDVKEAQKATEV